MNPLRWLKYSTLVAVTAVCSLLVSPSDLKAADEAPPYPHKDFSTVPECVLIRVVNGDTVILKVDGKSRRTGLLGLHTPPRSLPPGRASQRFLDNLLRGESVYAEYPEEHSPVDKFGRHPAYLYRAPDGLFVNLELLRQGYAELAEEPVLEHQELFEYFEKRAREHKKGNWANPAPEQSKAAGEKKPAAETGEEKTQPVPESADETTVYITPHGKKYHRKDCYHLRKNRIPLSLKEAKARGYQPCSHCKPPK